MLRGDRLDGWQTFVHKQGRNNDPQHIFTIKDGQLHVYQYAEDGPRWPMGYIATEKSHANHHLRLQYKWGTKRFKPLEK